MTQAGTVVLASTFLPDITAQLQADLPDWTVVAVDLGTRDRPREDIEDVLPTLAAADAIVPIRGVVDERVIRAAPGCKVIQQFGAGVDTVDMRAARARRIPVCNVPSRLGGNADSVAEMALFHLIAAGRDFPVLRGLVEAGTFAAPFGTSLYGKTVCIVGFGNIGQRVARLLRPFGCQVIGIRRRLPRAVKTTPGLRVWSTDRLDEAMSLSDFVVVTIPLTKDTTGIVGPRQFEAMRPGTRIVNVSRGGTIDRDGLLGALESGKVAAAGLDVFWEEPVRPDDPILGYNVVATPHCGGLTDHMRAGTSQVAAENIRRVVSGRPARFRVRL